MELFANGLGDQGSIPGRVIPKTLRMVLDTSLLNTQYYKVRIKGKVEQSRERSSAHPYTSVLKREPSGHPRLRSPSLLTYIYIYIYNLLRQKGKRVKTKRLLKVLRTHKKDVPVVNPSQGEHMLGLL